MLNELGDEHHIWKLEIREPFCLHHVVTDGVCPVYHHTLLDTIHHHKIPFIQGSMVAPPRHDDFGRGVELSSSEGVACDLLGMVKSRFGSY